MLDFASRGGVPVFRRPSAKPACLSEAERPVGGEAASFIRPAGYVVRPEQGILSVEARRKGEGGILCTDGDNFVCLATGRTHMIPYLCTYRSMYIHVYSYARLAHVFSHT